MSAPERSYPFFDPPWRRVAVVAVVALWLGFELLYSREPLWITIAAGMLAYVIWAFLLNWPKGQSGPSSK
jgi:hypothetical protein